MAVSDGEWVDLAANRPGQGVGAEAEAAIRAHPVVTVLGQLLRVQTPAAAWAKGSRGERLVGKRLHRLGPEWRVLHSIPVGTKGTDIDHLVIGPGGVFTLNTKNHLGQRVWVHTSVVMVNGQPQPYLRVSEHEARRAGRLLSSACGFPVAVGGVVVVLADSLRFAGHPDRVHLVGRRDVASWLGRRPRVLDTGSVESIYTVARRSTTWA